MVRRRTSPLALGAALLVAAALLTGCVPERTGSSPTDTPTATAAATPTESPTATPSPTSTAVVVAMPTDCRAILSQPVLDQLKDVPLNDPAFGASGVQGDTLVCIWGDPAADTTRLQTTISRMNRGPALDLLNDLVAKEQFTCYSPDAGTRCEKQWQNATYPVTDGRTLYWRDGILVDTVYSNLAPTGYTSSIIERVFAST